MPLIVFEGLDGAGKSTLMEALEGELLKKSLTILRTREPGGTELGDEIRHLILRRTGQAPCARTELLLYEAGRAQHVDLLIRPQLQKGTWILCDRFTASSIAFQAGGRSIEQGWVEKLNEFATEGLKPDLTVLLDLSVEESRRRRQNRHQKATGKRHDFHGHGVTQDDRMESEADQFHERVRQSFLTQARLEPVSWLILEASLSPSELLHHLMNDLNERGKRFRWPNF